MPCDRKFGNVSKNLQNIHFIGSPDKLVSFISNSIKNGLQVEKLDRKDIYKISVLTTKNKEDRVALIRKTEGKKFQKASVIVVRASYPDGYIIKDHINQKDDDATFVNLTLPNSTEHLDFSKIVLKPKYLRQIKIDTKKLDDLKTMSADLGESGEWITELEQQQINALDYKDDDGSIFIDNNFERDEEVNKK